MYLLVPDNSRFVFRSRGRYCHLPVNEDLLPLSARSARSSIAKVAAVSCAAIVLVCGQALAQPLKEEDRQSKSPAPMNPPPAPATAAAMDAYADRPVREVRLVGLVKTDAQFITNSIRSRVGQPLNPETVRSDVVRLNRLGKFREINARIQPYDDGSVEIIFQFVEAPVISAVDIVGNRQIPNAEISAVIGELAGTPVDEFQLGAARASIEKLYRDKGYFQATVTVDQKELESGVVLFRVAEGERVRVTDIRFEGNNNFLPRQLFPAIKTTTAGIFETGPVDNEQLDKDVAALVEFYRDRGYLDVRADKQVVFSPNGREAIVKFILDEGPLYTLRSVQAELPGEDKLRSGQPPTVLSVQQIAGLMEIKAGDVYSVDKIKKSVDVVRNAYLQMGYVDVAVARYELRDPNQPVVDLLLVIREGRAFKTGVINVKGNDITQDKVIYRELDIKPDRPLDASVENVSGRYVSTAEKRISDTRLFAPGSVKLTFQKEDPANPGYRDVLIEVEETNTGSLSFGAGITSDSGVIGLISLRQRNFDIADVPDSFGEFFSGRAFRGAGQEFEISLAPGTEVQTYSISLTDPALFDTDYSGSVGGFFREREFDEYNEQRISGRVSFGRKFGERWGGNLFFRYENIDVSDIASDAPVDLFAVEGANSLSGIGAKLTRSTVDSRFRPTRGSRMTFEIERIGAMGGDFDFTRFGAEHIVFFPVYETFLGYKTVLSFNTKFGYIPEGPDDAPTFERLYLGGNTFRGFMFRQISPKGIRNDNGEIGDDPVGGTWMFFTGLEINQPIWQDIISVVGFIDTGTVTEDPGFDEYRVSAGVGLRIYIAALGPVPLAFDFGFPILKEEGDRERVLSFSFDLPF